MTSHGFNESTVRRKEVVVIQSWAMTHKELISRVILTAFMAL